MPGNPFSVRNFPQSYRFSQEMGTFSALRKDTIPIGLPADRPRPGTIGKNHIQSSFTIGKNHIQSSFIFCIELLFLSALNLILS